jgi:hypothetical protein
MSSAGGTASGWRSRRLPSSVFWLTCLAVAPLACFGTAWVMVSLLHGQPASTPYRLLTSFFEFPATAVISCGLALHRGYGWLRSLGIALLSLLALGIWIYTLFSLLAWTGILHYPSYD